MSILLNEIPGVPRAALDNGEHGAAIKSTPLADEGRAVDAETIRRSFASAGSDLHAGIRCFVESKLAECVNKGAGGNA